MGGVVRCPSRVGRKIGLVYGAPGFGQGAVGKGTQDEDKCGYGGNGRPPKAYSLSLSLWNMVISPNLCCIALIPAAKGRCPRSRKK
jgi:hypothetical protein